MRASKKILTSFLIMGFFASEAISAERSLSWNPGSTPAPTLIVGEKAPVYSRLFVDARGNIKPQPAGLEIRSEWIWMPHERGGKVPLLRNWVKFPEGAEPTELSSATVRSEAGEWAYDFQPDGAPLLLKWKDKKGAKYESSWIAHFEYPFLWAHENCTENGVGLGFLDSGVQAESPSRGMIVLYCEDPRTTSGNLAYLHFFGEFQIGNTQPESAKPAQQSWAIPRQGVLLGASDSKIQIAGFELLSPADSNQGSSAGSRAMGVYQEVEEKSSGRRNWQGSIAAQTSSLGYNESTASGIERAISNQWGLTLKGGFDWSKKSSTDSIPSEFNRWNFGASAFGTVLSLSATQSGPVISTGNEGSAGAPRFLGVNLRAGRRLTSWGSPWDLRASAGFYYWSMLQASRDFGLDYLAGPQVVLSLRRNQAGDRAYGGYFKIARTGTEFGIGLDEGRELAIGGEFQLNSPGSKFRINGLVDIANTSLNAQESDRKMSLDSISIGVGIVF